MVRVVQQREMLSKIPPLAKLMDAMRDAYEEFSAGHAYVADVQHVHVEPRDEDGGPNVPESDDPLYDKAVACVAQAGYCSISHIQRQLSVGYNKAAKLVDRMEEEGVVGPASSKAGGRREVLITAL